MRRLAVIVATAAALSACGTDQSGTGTSPSPGGSTDANVTDLEITVVTDSGVEPKVMTLTCDPTGGDHPNADAACTSLARAGRSVFEPVPSDRVCTKIYGGPQTATITGVFRGADVDGSFNRSGGCEIDRWDALGTEVFDVPML